MTERTQTTVAGVNNLYVGNTIATDAHKGGKLVFADLRLERHDGEFETITHEKISQYDEVSISWSVYHRPRGWVVAEKGVPDDRHIESFGQTNPEERRISTTAVRLGLPDRQFIEQLWLDWHLNGMSARCDHMPLWPDLEKRVAALDDPPMKYGALDVTGWAIANVICPVTGYRWGTKWLVRPLPAEKRERFLKVIRENQR